jgi:hypothetical protein
MRVAFIPLIQKLIIFDVAPMKWSNRVMADDAERTRNYDQMVSI